MSYSYTQIWCKRIRNSGLECKCHVMYMCIQCGEPGGGPLLPSGVAEGKTPGECDDWNTAVRQLSLLLAFWFVQSICIISNCGSQQHPGPARQKSRAKVLAPLFPWGLLILYISNARTSLLGNRPADTGSCVLCAYQLMIHYCSVCVDIVCVAVERSRKETEMPS